MIAYLDASSFAALIFRDPGSDQLRIWIENTQERVLSDYCWGEFIAATSLRLRRSVLDQATAAATIAKGRLYADTCSRVRLRSADIGSATEIVARFELKLKLPDAIHIAIAQRLQAVLVTGDTRQEKAAVALGINVHNHLKGASA